MERNEGKGKEARCKKVIRNHFVVKERKGREKRGNEGKESDGYKREDKGMGST